MLVVAVVLVEETLAEEVLLAIDEVLPVISELLIVTLVALVEVEVVDGEVVSSVV